MHIEMNSESKKWIEAKGRQLTVKILETRGCCAPGVSEIIAVPAKPKISHHYKEFKVENLSIYVQKMLCNKEKLTLELSGISFLKSISASLE
jgi:hypothetical protein